MSQATELIARQMAAGSANARVWADILYNVKLYGAKGDWNGTTGTDDTASVQATIDAAIAAGGKAVFFPHGTYKVTVLTNLSSVVLFGDNASFSGITDTINQIGKPSSDLVYNVKDYGAKGDWNGVTGSDDTAAIQATINAAKLVGGQVWFPPGTYRVTNKITIDGPVTLTGSGWSSYPTSTSGTIIFADFTTATADSCLYVANQGVIIKDIEIKFMQPTPGAGWTPITTPWAIYAYRAPYVEVGGNDVKITNVMLRNPSHGIKLFGLQRAELNGIYGQPLMVGLLIDGMYDVVRVKNVHWTNAFWNGDANVTGYMKSNTTGISLGRVDGIMLEDYFVLSYQKGISISNSTLANPPGTTERGQATNIYLDDVFYGIVIDGSTTNGMSMDFANLQIYCNSLLNGSRGIYTLPTSGNVKLGITGGDITASYLEALRIDGTNNRITMTNMRVRSYNQGNVSSYAMYNGDPSNEILLNNAKVDTASGNGMAAYLGGGFRGYYADGGELYQVKEFTGTLDAAGEIQIAHGITSLNFKAMILQCFFSDGAGSMLPMNLSFMNSTTIKFTGGVASRKFRATVMYNFFTDSNWV